MKKNFFPFILIAVAIISILATQSVLMFLNLAHQSISTQTIGPHAIGSTILATGTVHSQSEATLHFQTGGKLVYLPFKEGDTVTTGQTIASLDTYALQRELTAALNTYQSTRDTFDQTQANAQTGALQNGQNSTFNPVNQSTLGGNVQTNAINDAVKRIIDQNQANLDNSVINVQLANEALQLATLTAPFNGIITSEDVTVAGQNITTATSFSLADPSELVFRADVGASDIDFISVGASAMIKLNRSEKYPAIYGDIPGIVTKIYPQRVTLPAGEQVYQVDIQTPNLQNSAKLAQTGSVLITNSLNAPFVTIPTWTILNHNQIWVEENGKPILKTVLVLQVHGGQASVSGLVFGEKIITNPASIASQKYSLL